MGNQPPKKQSGESKVTRSTPTTVIETSQKENEPDVEIDARLSSEQSRPLSVEDFELLKVLGKGSFGKVMLVKKKNSGELYAMKTLRKQALVKRNQLQHTQTERYVLQHIQHPFLVNLCFAFQSPDKLYMVLEYCAGGELFFWLKKHKRFSENRTQLMGAEILLALQTLHSHNIIYRDLKPENILLDSAGHVKITDFGLSKEGITGAGAEGGTHTFCGTPEYLAPEVLNNKGHGKAVDWWSFGTLLYEMLCGLPPFYDVNVQRMYHLILYAPLRCPSYLSNEAVSIISALLQRNVSDRLGSGPTDGEEIKQHAFFSSLDFELVYNRQYTPEFVPPQARRSVDVQNFDTDFTKEKAIDSVVQAQLSATMEAKTKFEQFTFTANTMES